MGDNQNITLKYKSLGNFTKGTQPAYKALIKAFLSIQVFSHQLSIVLLIVEINLLCWTAMNQDT
jgi:hypothetical protein